MLKILVVEDNEMNRTMLTRRLERRGFDVIAAADGREAVAATQRLLPDIILMDLSLPVVDGWTASRQIKTDPATADIPIIALTAHAMVEDRQRALDAGCDAYETKPVDMPRLLAVIETLAGRPIL
jgi:CheY-like chemotaxis protein